MEEQWQLYSESAKPIAGSGASKDDVLRNGLLHGASHVWIWRNNEDVIEVLLQKRSNNKRTWPGRLDISAAGHIDLGETPLEAAIRETEEEIGIDTVDTMLQEFSMNKVYKVIDDSNTENELQWLYLMQLASDQSFTLQESEVDSLLWLPLDEFQKNCRDAAYVPHGDDYYNKVIEAITDSSSRQQ